MENIFNVFFLALRKRFRLKDFCFSVNCDYLELHISGRIDCCAAKLQWSFVTITIPTNMALYQYIYHNSLKFTQSKYMVVV